ncbi:MAG: porin family protein [Myxococcales bacterium]|nr:porin family protein [Myxococcales bacterium]
MRPVVLFLALAALHGAPAVAEESRWNVHLQTGPVFTVVQPNAITTDQLFTLTGVHLRGALEYEFMERVGVELGYGANLLFHQINGTLGAQQLIFAGARVRPWWNPSGGYLLPRPTAAKDRKPLYLPDLISDAWVDAHVALALSDKTRFAYDVGIGTRVALISPIQLGLFVRWQHLIPSSGDKGFMQVLFGVTVSVGFLPVHSIDADDDGVTDGSDKCPGTTRGVRVNEFGCEIRESETKPPPCSDTDLDGICDGRDDCNDTPLGAPIDKKGCPLGGPPPQAE